MDKHMKKAKTSDGAAVANVHHARAYLGVRTRAKTTVLKRSYSPLATSAIFGGITKNKSNNECYLQLRSRRVERRVAPLTRKANKNKCSPNVRVNLKQKSEYEVELVPNKFEAKKKVETGKNDKKDGNGEKEEGSFGENELDFENKPRESTPTGFIVESGIIKTPTSSSKATTDVTTIQENQEKMSSAQELEDFFAKEEKDQIKRFIEEYNFDPVNEKPLKGCYKWEKLKP